MKWLISNWRNITVKMIVWIHCLCIEIGAVTRDLQTPAPIPFRSRPGSKQILNIYIYIKSCLFYHVVNASFWNTSRNGLFAAPLTCQAFHSSIAHTYSDNNGRCNTWNSMYSCLWFRQMYTSRSWLSMFYLAGQVCSKNDKLSRQAPSYSLHQALSHESCYGISYIRPEWHFSIRGRAKNDGKGLPHWKRCVHCPPDWHLQAR